MRKIQRLLDELHRLVGEVLLVAHEGEDHADGETVAERQPRREIDGDDGLEPEDQLVQRAEGDFGAAEADVGVRDLGVAVEPLPFALALAVEQLQALDRPHASR